MNPRNRRAAPKRPRSSDSEPSAAKNAEIRDSQKRVRGSSAVSGLGLKEGLFLVALTIAVFLAYRPALHGEFLWDDDGHVTRPELRSWQGLGRIWCELGATQQYYPLLHTAFWVQHQLWGDATFGYHLTNLLLHIGAACLMASILRRLKIPGAYLAAAVFALHPVHVESVAWITELKNTLSAVFYLGAAWIYLRFDETRRTRPYLFALGLFVCGLLSKTVTATLPAALLVVFWWQRGRLSWRRDVLPLVPFFVLGALAGVLTAVVERNLIGAEGESFELTAIERCLVAGRTVWFYLGKILWPTNLTFIYPRWRVSQAVAWQYSFPIATLLLLSTLWSLRGRTRGPLAGMLYFIGTLFPVLGFLNVYPFRYSFVADHFQYLASLGAIVLVSAGVALLLGRRQLWQRPAGYALSLSLLAVLAGLTWRQSRMYSDIETLFRTTIARNPACWMAHNHLGILLAGRGQVPEAIDHFQTALNIKPDHAEGHHNLSKALQRQGALDQAIIHARQAIALDPRNTECHFHLGNMLSQRGRMDAAIDEFREALAIKPGFLKVHINLGIVLLGRGHLDEARHHFQQALTLDPKHAGARQNLGVVLYEQGRIPEALTCWREVLRVQPDQLAVLTRCAWILATDPDPAVRNGTEAVALAERAVRLSGGRDPAILDTLAAACAEAGQFPEALHFAQLALEQARALGHTALVEALPARIQLYRAGSAYREPRILSKGPSFPARR